MNVKVAEIDDVSYMYPRSPSLVLDGITLDIHQGEFLGLIGPTGAGKSTLCLALNGIVPQFFGGRFFGDLRIAGLDTVDHPISALSRHVGAVYEDPETQLVTTSVENEIAFALENQKVPRDEIMKRIPRALEAVRLEGNEKRHPHELSGGQKQRLAIAAALAVQPALLVLDEPTSQLDPVGAQEVFSTVRELNETLGITIVMASHAAEEMAEFTDRVVLLSGGKIVEVGPPAEIYSKIDLLSEKFLRPPQVAKTFYLIEKRGLTVPYIPVRQENGLALLSEVARSGTVHPPNLTSNPVDIRPGEPLLSVENLCHTYGSGMEALKEVSLDISEGEYVLIIGQNGAGKSTLVKHFLKLLEPTEGVVRVEGEDTRNLEMSDLARRIGYVAQNPDNQIFTSSVEAEVSFAVENLEFNSKEIERRVAESLENMGLLEMRKLHPLSLAKGDRARVVIAAILAMEPEIIIFDEPTTGQDYRGASYILEISRRLHEMGKTVIVITHHLYLMPEYAHRVIVMGKGTILLDASLREAFHELDLLHSTYLSPPQAVFLAQKLSGTLEGQPLPLLTPDEVAGCFSPENTR